MKRIKLIISHMSLLDIILIGSAMLLLYGGAILLAVMGITYHPILLLYAFLVSWGCVAFTRYIWIILNAGYEMLMRNMANN